MNADYQGRGLTSQRTRERMVERVRAQGVKNEAVLQRMLAVPRHLFIDEALSTRAYSEDALPIGNNQTISQPYIVARMTELLLQTEGPLENILEIGTGSGYQTAILSPFVKRIYTVERIETLLTQARKRFRALQLKNVRTSHADGGEGWENYAPFDGILVTAAPAGIPLKLVNQLRLGGRLILPVGESKESQALVLVVRTETGYEKSLLERVSFVPLLDGTL